jgi:hypothetical protein
MLEKRVGLETSDVLAGSCGQPEPVGTATPGNSLISPGRSIADRMGGKLGCHFVGHRKKAEKSLCSSSPSRPLDTACDLQGEVSHSFLVPLAYDFFAAACPTF